MGKIKTVYEDCDILVVGGGMAGTGATFEARSVSYTHLRAHET